METVTISRMEYDELRASQLVLDNLIDSLKPILKQVLQDENIQFLVFKAISPYMP